MPSVKRLLVIISLCVLVPVLAHTQNTLPPFVFTSHTGKVIKAASMPKGKPIVLVYFLPDCGHCQELTEKLTKNIKQFSKASILMLTCQPVAQVASFVKKYGLSKYSNMQVGTEVSNPFVRNYYRIDELPFIALYNKSGKLVKKYSRNDKLEDVSGRLKML